MRYFIEHETVLEYPEAVREHHVELRLTPREDSHQRLIAIELATEPPAGLRSYRDYYGNHVTAFDIIRPHRRLVTRMRAEVENTLENPFDFPPLPPATNGTGSGRRSARPRHGTIISSAAVRPPRLWDSWTRIWPSRAMSRAARCWNRCSGPWRGSRRCSATKPA
ncbi:hypothetical protein FO488_13930 [Geobacter sp. FeAm09]|uniref:transglutaminase N-terminal domain-containing protein n=1 Tax=Geobacter sp. FeAm09 TaxID=2597769 RepID=UPI0011F02CC1|nr:transglutaminase N-terminal domain-containing protein [Geobacter sp. FeAm09]QEM69150.1 hypothetical protein FO488_13930 [Geobacter sp. FeAm09]